MSFKQHLILVASIIIWVLSYNLWLFLGVEIYYVGTALLILGSSLVIDLQEKTKFQQLASKLFLILATNNVLDELFFDPQSFDYNEYLSIILYFIFVSWKILKN
jgi:hypothetical protein